MKSNYGAADWSFYASVKVLLSSSDWVEESSHDLLCEVFVMQAKCWCHSGYLYGLEVTVIQTEIFPDNSIHQAHTLLTKNGTFSQTKTESMALFTNIQFSTKGRMGKLFLKHLSYLLKY